MVEKLGEELSRKRLKRQRGNGSGLGEMGETLILMLINVDN